MYKLNKIYNIDCVEFMQKIEDDSISLIIADPPYNIAKSKPLTGNSHGKIKTLDADWDIFSSPEKYREFSNNWMAEAKRILKSNGSIFVYGNRSSIFEMKSCLDNNDLNFMDMITWVKRDSPPNITCRMYAHSTEFILWYCKAKTNWVFNHKEIKKYNNDKQMRNYWDIPRTMRKEEKTNHPTQKRIILSDIIVEGHSNIDDLVYIPFAGSGSEIESCIKLHRNWIATETNEEYIVKIINPRINKMKNL